MRVQAIAEEDGAGSVPLSDGPPDVEVTPSMNVVDDDSRMTTTVK